MKDYKDVSFLVHIRQDCKDRVENLNIIISYYKKYFKNCQFIIVEDDSNHDHLLSFDSLSLEMSDLLIHHYNLDIYERPLCYNIAARKSNRAVLIAMDTDVIISPDQLDNAIESVKRESSFGMCLPYNGISLYTEPHVKEIFQRAGYDYASLTQFVPPCTEVGYRTKHLQVANVKSIGGCFVFSRKNFFRIGGFNPKFKGWGYEDNELLMRISRMGLSIGRPKNPQAFLWHLAHPGTAKSNHPYYRSNQKLSEEAGSIDRNSLELKILEWKNAWQRKDFQDFIRGKKVAIVGPAPHIVGSKQGAAIDDHDVVIRINKAVPTPSHLVEDVGCKCDVLYNCLNVSEECGGAHKIEEWAKAGVKWLVCPYTDVHPFDKDIAKFSIANKDDLRFAFIDRIFYGKTASTLGTRPNSGFMAMIDIIENCSPSEVYITGFSFFKGGYYSAYREKNEKQVMDFMASAGNHSQQPQIDYFFDLLHKHPSVKIDDYLQKMKEEMKK